MVFNPWNCDCDPWVEELSVLKLTMCVARRVLFFFFCNHCLNGKIIMVKKNKSRVYYSLRTLCYITMEHLIKQNVVVSGMCLCADVQGGSCFGPAFQQNLPSWSIHGCLRPRFGDCRVSKVFPACPGCYVQTTEVWIPIAWCDWAKCQKFRDCILEMLRGLQNRTVNLIGCWTGWGCIG